MPRAFLGLIVLVPLTACVAYKVTPTDEFDAQSKAIQHHLRVKPEEAISIQKLNELPEGLHCFEPLLYVLSLGIIPTHCLDRYHVSVSSNAQSNAEDLRTDFEVTVLQGWVALLLPVSPHWKFGYGQNAEEEIQSQVGVD